MRTKSSNRLTLLLITGALIEYGLANKIENVTARSDLEVKAGDNLKIVCNEVRIENRRIVWFIREKGELEKTICSKRPSEESCDTTISYPRYQNSIVINDTSVLVLTLQGNESGDYGCIAVIGQDTLQKIYGNITVVVKPRGPPLLASKEVLRSKTAEFRCLLPIVPSGNLTYWWQKQGSTGNIELGSRDRDPVYSIPSAQPAHTGNYRCRGTNIAGDSGWSSWATLDVLSLGLG